MSSMTLHKVQVSEIGLYFAGSLLSSFMKRGLTLALVQSLGVGLFPKTSQI